MLKCDAIRSNTLRNFHQPTTFKSHVQTGSEQIIISARQVFRINMRELVLKLQPFENCQFVNCSHLIVVSSVYNNFFKTNHIPIAISFRWYFSEMIRLVYLNFGHSALTSSFIKYYFFQMKNCFS